MKFNEKLTLLRQERNMNMTEFANLLGTSKQVIRRYEIGENTPKITTVSKYAQILGVSLSYLINEDCTDRNAGIKKVSPSELTEGEKLWLELYYKVSNETRETLVAMMLSFDKLPQEEQKVALRMIRAALGTHE